MQTAPPASAPDRGPASAPRPCGPSWSRRAGLPLAGLLLCTAAGAQGVNYGPFSINAFVKTEAGRANNQGKDIQLYPGEDKQRIWADQLVVGRPYGTEPTSVWLFQPWLGAKFDLGGGFKLSALLSQRWRGGRGLPNTVDIPGFVYEENVAISHEDYGSLRVGKMVSRTWSIADYPYGTNIGLADEWAASGAGYGLNTSAVRYTSRQLDAFNGDLVLEATYDRGNTAFRIHKPRFIELFAQYHQGDLVVDAFVQDTRNGNPQAWAHGPFTGPTPFPKDDPKLGGSGQGMAMVMARYEVNARWQVSGGLRRNRWSGAYALITTPGTPATPTSAATPDQWNNMFNVDWSDTSSGLWKPGYAATSTDGFAGVYRRMEKWSAWTALQFLGRAATANPSERGQSNWAGYGTAGLSYDFGRGMKVYGSVGLVHYGRLGLSPMSMPTNSAFTGVDSRVTRNGNWFLLGAVYVL